MLNAAFETLAGQVFWGQETNSFSGTACLWTLPWKSSQVLSLKPHSWPHLLLPPFHCPRHCMPKCFTMASGYPSKNLEAKGQFGNLKHSWTYCTCHESGRGFGRFIVIPSLCRWGNWDPERDKDLSKATGSLLTRAWGSKFLSLILPGVELNLCLLSSFFLPSTWSVDNSS